MRNIKDLQVSQINIKDGDFKIGDYVFATKYQDADPNDRCRVDIVEVINEYGGDGHKSKAILFKETGVIPYWYAQKISKEEGEMILKNWECQKK